ncbi:MAG: hypothetical protein JXA53_02860 [Bacteroidales bacterium]|nr:hypothetical protein [Bacteroidales bacterium]
MESIKIKLKPKINRGIKTAIISFDGELNTISSSEIQKYFLNDTLYFDKYILDFSGITNFSFKFIDVIVTFKKIEKKINRSFKFKFDISCNYNSILDNTNFYNYNIQN